MERLLDGSLADASFLEVLIRAALPIVTLPMMLLVVLMVVDRVAHLLHRDET
ncbi:MAG TPA: hypothetical protein VJ815_10990 [Acidimicrobiia bacterium]|nr:hypothetical protein [Acidimicrobiia bacterium]